MRFEVMDERSLNYNRPLAKVGRLEGCSGMNVKGTPRQMEEGRPVGRPGINAWAVGFSSAF
jgi:hypothetical protein